jgi:hypothetical protein
LLALALAGRLATVRIRRALLLIAAAASAVAGFGYGIALWGQTACEAEMQAEVLGKNVTGVDMEGRVILPSQIHVYSHIESPFVVVAGYAVPYDLHASYHEARFLVLPGYIRRQASQTHHAM